ncbi:hypothetical protein RRG08_053587 [Elysia crispata]|uniref:Secreted protein n=1 Tax=Elysia crispata TaxID=231223 RepID=A0AAE0Y2A5_9GAST|nr:hypothetical protein RRG08_053587 [Elysia crispata]
MHKLSIDFLSLSLVWLASVPTVDWEPKSSRCCQPVKTLYMYPSWTWAITVRLIQLQVLSTSQDSLHVSILDMGNNRPSDPAPGVVNQSRLSTCVHIGHGQ